MIQRLTLVLLLLTCACAYRSQPLPVFSQVPEFVLTAQTGEEFDSSRMLRGKVWVADFMFTSCTGPCPRMGTQMKQVQQGLQELDEIRLVSFSVDPKNDTPEVLAAYARRYGAEPGRWFFLTGATEALHKLNREAFLLGNTDGKNLDHSTRFVLVDRLGRVRNYYDTSESGTIPALIADAKALAREAS